MDHRTRIGAPASFPHNPDSFQFLNEHATRLLDFHGTDCHHSNFKFPVSKSNWSVVTRVSHERDEDSDDKHSAAVAEAAAVGNPVPPTPPQKLHFRWGLEYVQEDKPSTDGSAAAAAAALVPNRSNANGVKPRVVRADHGTVFKGSVENDGTLDLVLEHRVSRNFSFKSYGIYYDAPNQSLVGMNLRLDGSSWNTDLKAGTDGGVGAMSAAYSPLVGTMIGCEAFYIRAEKGPIYAIGVKQNLSLARWLKPSQFSFTATSLGALQGLYSAPIIPGRLKVATRYTYDLAMFESSWSVGAECWPFRFLFGPRNSKTPAAATTPESGSSSSMIRDAKVQAMIDPHQRYAVSLSLPVTPQLYVGGSVSKRWTAASTELPTVALSFTYE